MPTELIQRRIDRLLDQAEEAIDQGDRDRVSLARFRRWVGMTPILLSMRPPTGRVLSKLDILRA